jgi:pimeloyl-ACP methyl ester carboxylesterase
MPAGLRPPFRGYSSAKYSDPAAWLCRPDLPSDPCRTDLTATELLPDGTRAVVPFVPASEPKVDCFYVYPTVDLSLFAGNHTDFRDRAPMTRAAVTQVARFREVCDLYVPLYRQITIGTYLGSASSKAPYTEVAFSDVADAFAHYLGQHNHGRKIVLIGHSQGAEMVVELLKRYFDPDPAMRERLLVAMAIGWSVDVPQGQRVGGTFANLPLCAAADDVGCVVAYRSHRAGADVSPGRWAPPPGQESACVNPASVDRNERRWVSGAYFPVAKDVKGSEGVTTPAVVFRQLYTSQCMNGRDGYRYLGIGAAPGPGDQRRVPLDLGDFRLNTAMGLHILDLQFPQGDLVNMVAQRVKAAAALPAAPR